MGGSLHVVKIYIFIKFSIIFLGQPLLSVIRRLKKIYVENKKNKKRYRPELSIGGIFMGLSSLVS